MSDGGILESTRSTAGCRISTGVHWVARTAASAAAATAAADVESDASERADAAEVYLLSPCMAPEPAIARWIDIRPRRRGRRGGYPGAVTSSSELARILGQGPCHHRLLRRRRDGACAPHVYRDRNRDRDIDIAIAIAYDPNITGSLRWCENWKM